MSQRLRRRILDLHENRSEKKPRIAFDGVERMGSRGSGQNAVQHVVLDLCDGVRWGKAGTCREGDGYGAVSVYLYVWSGREGGEGQGGGEVVAGDDWGEIGRREGSRSLLGAAAEQRRAQAAQFLDILHPLSPSPPQEQPAYLPPQDAKTDRTSFSILSKVHAAILRIPGRSIFRPSQNRSIGASAAGFELFLLG